MTGTPCKLKAEWNNSRNFIKPIGHLKVRRNRAAHSRRGVGAGGLPLAVWVNCLLAGAAPRFPDSWMYLFTVRSLIWGVSLVVLWLGLGNFTLVARIQSLVKGLRSCKPCGQKKKKVSFFPSKPRLACTRFNTQSKCFLSMYLDHALLTKYLCIYLFAWLHWVLVVACGILAPWPGIEPGFPALGVWSLSHWTTREVPCS